MSTFTRTLSAAIGISVLMLFAVGMAQDGTWTATNWVDPATGAELPALVTPVEFGFEGQGVIACEFEGSGGLTLALESDELSELPGAEIVVGYQLDMGEPVLFEPGTWERQDSGAVLRFVGPQNVLADFMVGLVDAISPAFVVFAGTFDEAPEGVMVLESQGLDAALAALPCSPGGG